MSQIGYNTEPHFTPTRASITFTVHNVARPTNSTTADDEVFVQFPGAMLTCTFARTFCIRRLTPV